MLLDKHTAKSKLKQPIAYTSLLSWLLVLIEIFVLHEIHNVIKETPQFILEDFHKSVKKKQKEMKGNDSKVNIELFYCNSEQNLEQNLFVNVFKSIQFRRKLLFLNKNIEYPHNVYTLSQCISAYLLHSSISFTAYHKNLNLNKRSLLLHDIVSHQLNSNENFITIETKKIHKNNKILNLYQNMLQSKDVLNFISSICNFNISNFLDLKNNIGEKIFAFNNSTCDACKSNLILCKHYGIIKCVAFDNLNGPIIGLTFLRHCPYCKSKFCYNRKYDPAGNITIYDVTKFDFFGTRNSTYFHKDLLYEVCGWNIGNCVPIYRFSDIYNDRFHQKIKDVADLLKAKGDTLGHRKRYDAVLTYKILKEAFYLYWLLTILFKHNIGEKIIITYNEIAHVLNKKKEIREKFCKLKETKSKFQLSETDIFNLLYEKYYNLISNIHPQIIQVVPVTNYKIETRHFLIQGDGGRKPAQLLCRIPVKYFKRFGDNNIECGIIKCPNNPFNGNKHYHSFYVCVNCALTLYDLGLHATEINKFIEWIELKESKQRIITSMKKTNDASTLKELEMKLNHVNYFLTVVYKKFESKFIDIATKILQSDQNTDFVLRRSERLKMKCNNNNNNNDLNYNNNNELLDNFVESKYDEDDESDADNDNDCDDNNNDCDENDNVCDENDNHYDDNDNINDNQPPVKR